MIKKQKMTEIIVMVCITIALLAGTFGSTGETLVASAAQKNAVYQQYSKKIDKRVKQIKNHKTDIKTVGTVFYVSSSTGDDANDGLSPETAWKTCKRVNEDQDGVIYQSVEENGGATILFKRGDTWKRDGIDLWYPNMVYSTYGTGAKPVFDFSLAEAADPSMWTLKKGTKNIWVYRDKVPFLGSLTLNNRTSADNYVGYYDYRTGKWYECCPNGHYKDDNYCCKYKAKQYLNVNKLPNNSFFVDVRPSKKYLDKASGDLYVYDCDEKGTLYFSCKKGNAHSLGIIHIWDCSGDVNLSDLKLTNNLFLYTEDRVINLEQVKRKKMMTAKNNVAILKKKSGMNFLRVTDRDWNETYYNSLSKAKTYIGNFGKIKWVD